MNKHFNGQGVSEAPASDEWAEAQRICDLPDVDEAIRGLTEDPTGDNAVCVVRSVLRAATPASPAAVPEVGVTRNRALEDAAQACINLGGSYFQVGEFNAQAACIRAADDIRDMKAVPSPVISGE